MRPLLSVVFSVVLGLWVIAAGTQMLCPPAMAQENVKTESDELTRKPKTKVAPIYPDVARRMGVSGTVKLSVVVAPNGTVKSSKVVGGHPVLVNAAMDAMKQWKFESAPTESSGIVEFKFQPQN
ncbi:MAG: energy transducer TonB [Terriglobales bacterium]